ncbi:MAG: alpha/beta hydrolase [Azoarcus sp.]|jgi:predicted alpha/beta superfamily hydrolase|nr:alpha/beta hydrolase [Azoarcus sp.]
MNEATIMRAARPVFVLVLLSAVFILALHGGAVFAQPRPESAAIPNVVARGSAHYTFDAVTLEAPGGGHRYRIQIARPRQAAPEGGYPAIFLLDGNAAIAALDETLLGELAESGPPVIVAIGHDTPARFDVAARAYDYTPPLPGEADGLDPLDPARRNGGAARFLDFIEKRIKPEVAARVPLDPARQGLWGHSYGGLFVLYTLLTHPGMFSAHAAASPSLWWHDAHLLTLEAGFAQRFAGHRARLLALRGGAEGSKKRPGASPARLARRERAMAALPADAASALTARLGAIPGLEADYRELPGLEHGPMLPASVGHALRWMTANPAWRR